MANHDKNVYRNAVEIEGSSCPNPILGDLRQGQMFRYVSSLSNNNIYMVTNNPGRSYVDTVYLPTGALYSGIARETTVIPVPDGSVVKLVAGKGV